MADYVPLGRSTVDYDRKTIFGYTLKADKSFKTGDFKESAKHYSQAADAYRKVAAEMQRELLDESRRREDIEDEVSAMRLWMQRFRQPQMATDFSQVLDREQVYKALAAMRYSPKYIGLFNLYEKRLSESGDPMTMQRRWMARIDRLFGFDAERLTLRLSYLDELIFDAVRSVTK